MKKLLLTLTAFASLTMSVYAVSDTTFFSGVHLDMTIDQCVALYRPLADGGILEHSGAPAGERQVDFRTASNPQRRVYVYFRKSDRKIVSITYWKMGANEGFSPEEIRLLLAVNSGHGSLVTLVQEEYKSDSGTEFEITTSPQYQLEQAQN